MKIRPANKEDIKAIIPLLQASLGESLLKKSVEIWNFKHIINPFGESTVLLAEENSALIGLRAFMSWRWQLSGQVWTAYRAVDTATHPNHQGKGIFKKLTLQGLEEVQQKGDCFVFNTPNDQSRPGYLKMGWIEVGKIKVALIPIFFYFMFFFKKSTFQNIISESDLNDLCDYHNEKLCKRNKLFTPKSYSYLKWRYEENPLQKYYIYSTSNCYVSMYVKKHKYYKELRVVEVLSKSGQKINTSIKKAIITYAIKNSCLIISMANKEIFSFKIVGSFGPILTYRSLTNNEIFDKHASNISNWNYSLGDLELF